MKKIFFYHIPKTGGTSFDELLKCEHLPENISKGFDQKSIEEELSKQLDYSYFSGHVEYDFFRLHFSEHSAFKAVTFLRNPIKRLVSQYRNWKNPSKHQSRFLENDSIRHSVLSVQKMSFKDFLECSDPIIRMSVSNVFTRFLTSGGLRWHEVPNISYCNELVDEAFSNLTNRFIGCGLLENLSDSLIDLSSKLGIGPKRRMNHSNISDDEITISDSDLAYAASLNRMDLMLYEQFCRHHQLTKESSYEAAAFSCISQLSCRTSIRASDHCFGDGWSFIESGVGNIKFRWTTGEANIFIPNGEQSMLFLYIYGIPHFNTTESLRLYIDGMIMELKNRRKTDYGEVLVYAMPKKQNGASYREIKLTSTTIKYEQQDFTRELGIAFAGIDLL